MTPDVLERQTRVVTIAFGLDADPALEVRNYDPVTRSQGQSLEQTNLSLPIIALLVYFDTLKSYQAKKEILITPQFI